jgi:hypothetical protein
LGDAGGGVSVGVGSAVGIDVGVEVGAVIPTPHPDKSNAMEIRPSSRTSDPFQFIGSPLFRMKLDFVGKSIIAQDQAQLPFGLNGVAA